MQTADTSRTISTAVRPARVAILINKADQDWMQSCLRIIEWTTCVWGGWYSCIIPTDGNTLEERFWEILEEFDPDYIRAYQKLGRDIKIASPERFQIQVEAQFNQFVKDYPDSDNEHTRRTIERNNDEYEIENFEISEDLTQLLISRLNPFHFEKQERIHHIVARPKEVSYPLTAVSTIAKYTSQPLRATIVDFQASPLLELAVYSMAGKTWDGLENELKDTVELIREDHTNTSLLDLLSIPE